MHENQFWRAKLNMYTQVDKDRRALLQSLQAYFEVTNIDGRLSVISGISITNVDEIFISSTQEYVLNLLMAILGNLEVH